jgi:hypothetical protein
MINEDRPTLGPSTGRKSAKDGSARLALVPMCSGLPAASEGRKLDRHDWHLGNVG